MSSTQSPNWREILSARSTITGQQEYLTSTNGVLNTSSGGGGGGSVTITSPIGQTTASASVSVIQASDANLAKETGGNLATVVTNQTNGTQQAKITDGTNIANTLKSDGTAVGQNSLITGGTGYTAATITLNLASPNTQWFDLLNYPGISLEILTNTAPSTLTFMTSSDAAQTNSRNMLMYDSQTNNGSGSVTSNSAVSTFVGNRTGRYFRITSNVSGANSITLVLTFYTVTMVLPSMGVVASQAGTWNVGASTVIGATTPANAFYMGINNGTNLVGALALDDNSNGVSSSATVNKLAVLSRNTLWFNSNATWERARQAEDAINSLGTGIAAAGIAAQLDDTSPTAITENRFGNLRMSADRSLLTTQRALTPTQTSVAASASSVSLLAANNARKGATITNDSTAVMYLKLGATASTTSYTVTLAGAVGAPFAYYEVPFGYVGAIDAIWGSATGNARITELT